MGLLDVGCIAARSGGCYLRDVEKDPAPGHPNILVAIGGGSGKSALPKLEMLKTLRSISLGLLS